MMTMTVMQEGAEAEMEQRHLFLTAGHLGSLRLYDSRCDC